MKIYKHDLRLDIKAIEGDEKKDWVVTGYASVFGNIDGQREIVEEGSFRKSIRGKKVPIFLNHNPDNTIGKSLSLKEDKDGLKIRFNIFNDDRMPKAKEAACLIEKYLETGDEMGLSIGGRVIKSDVIRVNERSIFKILEFDLMEVSVTPIPANREARINNIKNLSTFIKRKDGNKEILLNNLALLKECNEKLKNINSKEGCYEFRSRVNT